jgi:ribosomal-protein-alanine N-acetyltransferase
VSDTDDADPVVLRRMRWWDVESVLAMERQLFPVDAWSADTFWSELAGVPRRRHYVVAEEPAGCLLGYAGLACSGGGDADVQTLGVRRDAQGRGIGAALLAALLAEASRRGNAAVLLEVRADNVAAQHLYASVGFERIGVRRGYYDGGRVDALVLRRRLAPVRR